MTSRGATRMMSILSLLLGMAAVGAIWAGASWLDAAGSSDHQPARLKIMRELPSTATTPLENDPCLFDTSPWNQVVVAEASGEIVASFWPETGLIETDQNGAAHCIVYAEFQLPASDFYTLHVNDRYSWVVTSREVSAEDVPVAWLDAEPIDFGPTNDAPATPEPAP